MSAPDSRLHHSSSGPHPAQLPSRIEEAITNALRAVAKEADFELRALYHGESLWYLRSRKGQLVRRVQVSAIGSPLDLELQLVPDLYEVDEVRHVMRTLTGIPREAIQSLSVRELYGSGSKESPESTIKRKAWDAIKALDLLDVKHLDRIIPLQEA